MKAARKRSAIPTFQSWRTNSPAIPLTTRSPLPAEEQPVMLASAFLIGTCAMWISDLLFEMIVRRFVPKEPDGTA